MLPPRFLLSCFLRRCETTFRRALPRAFVNRSLPRMAAGAPTKVSKDELNAEMATGYDPTAVEKTWYKWWETEGFFRPKSDERDPDTDAKKFVLVLPPPNVTGHLHSGHALTGSVQDAIVRFQRMKGRDTLYLPGYDHAGIATQVVVEKLLKKKEGKSRHDVGREAFLKKVWEYKEENSHAIQNQLRITGSSLDWTRARFTMDDHCANAVREAFCKMSEAGIVYRAKRLVNWCCALQSAISDIEVEGFEVEEKSTTRVPGYDKPVDIGTMTHVAYKVDGTDGKEELVFATTRPETMLGDAALAVHPEDERYKKFHGKTVTCPWRECSIPIITDPVLVDKDFGTGVVKVTPAHDPNDYETGKRHNLESIQILDLKGHIILDGKYKGLNRFECRKQIVKDLETMGILRGITGHSFRVGRCSRTKDIVEPMLMEQWFIDCSKMAKRSADAVRSGELKLLPETHNSTWYHYLDNIQPWCVSRQLWWGHRIPAYQAFLGDTLCEDKAGDSWVVARSEEDARQLAQAKVGWSAADAKAARIAQDPDVLDTWFSSAMWPFSTMGWPNAEAADLKRFYPNSLLETGHDILFFWVARMVMVGYQLMDTLPFKEVYLHAMVRDKEGKKMSKSTGNVIDPLDVVSGTTLEAMHDKVRNGNLDAREVEKAIKLQKRIFPKEGIPACGADALRYGLLAYTQSGKSVNLDVNHVIGYREFCNKLWNVTRYTLYHALDKSFEVSMKLDSANKSQLPLECAWILSRLDVALEECNRGMSEGTYDFALATTSCYRFWKYELCDVFLELTKPVLQMGDEGAVRKTVTRHVFLHVVESGLRMLHPMMPFVSEELWHRLPHKKTFATESIMIAAYPQPAGWRDLETEAKMKSVQDVIHSLRSLKASYNLTNKVKPDVYVIAATPETQVLIAKEAALVEALAWVGKVTVLSKDKEGDVPTGCGFVNINHAIGAHMMLKGIIDVTQEVKKLEKELGLKQKSLDGVLAKMNAPNYETKVPENVRKANAEKADQLKAEVAQTQQGIQRMKDKA